MGDALPYVDLGTRLGLPPPLAGPVEVFDVVAGQGHFCALIKDWKRAGPAVLGVVKCWGGG